MSSISLFFSSILDCLHSKQTEEDSLVSQYISRGIHPRIWLPKVCEFVDLSTCHSISKSFCSTDPELNKKILQAAQKAFLVEARNVGYNIKVPPYEESQLNNSQYVITYINNLRIINQSIIIQILCQEL